MDFFPGFDTPEIKEYQETLSRFMEVERIVNFLDEAHSSRYLTKKEKENIGFLLSDFGPVEHCLMERLGLNL